MSSVDESVGRGGGASGSQAAPAVSPAYRRLHARVAEQRCVLLDGGAATQLPRQDTRARLDEETWGARALVEDPHAVVDIHRRYAAAGADVISTLTWGVPSAVLQGGPRLHDRGRPVHWMDLARRGVRVAREAVAAEGREGECAVAFSVNADLDSPDGAETVRLLSRVFADEPPDVVLFETLSLVRASLYDTVAALVATGVPVWLSFRRCPQGLCGVFGEHWGGPEGDAFGRAARRFEDLGAGALLVNCIPPDHVDGMVSYLRDFTDVPLGVYPNLGYYTSQGWQFDPGVGGDEYAAAALRWRAEGAQIIGGCCGVGPEHIAAAAGRLADVPPGDERRHRQLIDHADDAGPASPPPAWTDQRGRQLYPLAFPELVAEEGVALPDGPGLMAWKHLFDEGVGARQRCLDVGSGTGVLAVQLALNGAAHVRAIDVHPQAADNTMTNAFRNGVAERVSAATVDLYPWVPEERYEVIVASLFQTPVDPAEQATTHRPLDYWGRGHLDQLISKLPRALAPEGVAYVVHLSILSQQRTEELLAAHGLRAEVAAYQVVPMPAHLRQSLDHLARVEELSDAHHLTIGDQAAVVAYLLAIRRGRPERR